MTEKSQVKMTKKKKKKIYTVRIIHIVFLWLNKFKCLKIVCPGAVDEVRRSPSITFWSGRSYKTILIMIKNIIYYFLVAAFPLTLCGGKCLVTTMSPTFICLEVTANLKKNVPTNGHSGN